MITVKNLFKRFGSIKAVNNVNFCINKGEIVTLLGANGAGKSTLMRLICGVLAADSGDIDIFNFNIKSHRVEALKKIGYMPEDNPIYGDMNVSEFLYFIAKLHQLSTSELRTNINYIVKQLQLGDVLGQRIDTLSKGFKGRVAVASCLVHNPKVLILDEPTEGLDPNQKFYLREIIKEYGKENIVLLSTHIIEEVEEVATRVLFLSRGKLIRDTSVIELKKQNPDLSLNAICRQIMNEEI